MMSILTIFLFFLYLWGFGFTATYYLKKPLTTLERFFVNLAVGLGVFVVVSIFLNFLHLPLDWKIFLLLSTAFPLFIFIKHVNSKNISSLLSFKWKATTADLLLGIVILIALIWLLIYLKGAFAYPYLEDEDPWGHAVGVKYVALEKVAYDPNIQGLEEIDTLLSYIDPYPPGYNILLGILHQTSSDLTWTLKFFNSLLIALGLIFFYLLAQQLMESRQKAVLATFILSCIPAYFSHFIWAHVLVVMLFFPTMYAFLMIGEDKKWWLLAAVLVASIWLSQNIEQPLKLTTMIILFIIIASIVRKQWMNYEWSALIAGIGLSFLWWGVMIQKYTLSGFLGSYKTGVVGSGSESSGGIIPFLISMLKTLTNPEGTASRAYSLRDFFIASKENMINSPIGIGIVVSLLVLFSVSYLAWKYRSKLVEEKNVWLSVSLFWLIFAFWAVNGITFPVSVAKGAFRSWMLLAFVVALVASEGSFIFARWAEKYKIPAMMTVGILIIGILFTSGYQKYAFNTTLWPTSGTFSSPQEPFEYGTWFSSIPKNTPVFLYAPRDKITIGYGAYSCEWCQDEIDFRKDIIHKDAAALHTFLQNKHYQYLVLNGRMDAKYFKKQFGENETNILLPKRYEEILNSGLFTTAYQKGDLFVVLKVN